MKKILCFTLALIITAFALVACSDTSTTSGDGTGTGTGSSMTHAADHTAPAYKDIDRSKVYTLDGVEVTDEQTDYVLIEVEGYGKMLARLYPDVAPATVANFKKLVSKGFYDGLIFHRVIKDFMIQGGDPDGNGTGGSDENVIGEFSQNGFTNNLKHKRGVLSMARSNDVNSASSQFYICHKTSGVEHLDGSYAAFGYVVYGLDVIDDIAAVKTDSNDKPLTDVVITSIKFVTVPDSALTEPETTADTTETAAQ